ncbi:hypothetical protein CANINC_001433 [Pichia inconspicua]|uniref:Uncharacterized protein n=1 Tax=Pichia inconspicua TaxID=52247 RepID=A0A4T0X4R8_9ASCO|nr:hypothetical protein CANINC_001433 [[Candida] inconspicua]
MKIVFPDSVEKELQQQKQQPQNSGVVPKETQVSQPTQLSPKEVEELNRRIQNTTSKLYTPKSPLAPEFKSRSAEIEERLKRIQERFAAVKIKEEARNAEIRRQAWLKYSHLTKPTIQDFKRPITTFFLFASAVYMTMQYSWHLLENEDFVENMESHQKQLVKELNLAFANQAEVMKNYEDQNTAGKWWKLWR